jgi:antitoxin (DNA-binding transcriptional repressor) of toxin-antitoxin stability system
VWWSPCIKSGGLVLPGCRAVLHLTHMETIGVRELQQHASAALRRVEGGETIGVTDRGRLVAILAPPSSATGAGALMASGRVQLATRAAEALPESVFVLRSSAEVLDELRNER